jgi:hypothetical protein
MGGLNIPIGGLGARTGVKLGPSLSGPAATIAQVAYGQGSAPSTTDNEGIEAYHLAIAVPVVALAWLAFLRWSLPG